MKILICDDNEANLRRLEIHVKEYMKNRYIKAEFYCTSSASEAFSAELDFDLAFLDIQMPDIDGLEICKKIRRKSDIPIIISSARGDISDKVVGFQIGADDYLPKPYDPKEMYARITSLTRRAKKSDRTTFDANYLFKVDAKRHEIYYNKQVLTLTPAEYDILSFLINQHGFAVSREQLIHNSSALKYKDSKSIDVIIGRLRAKINDSSKNPKHIFSVRGIGYKLIG